MEAKVIAGKAKPRGRYPHVKRAGDLVFVSGISARRPDDSFDGVTFDATGRPLLDIREQTRAVIQHIADILAAVDARLDDLVQINCFLVDMGDFAAYNATYEEFFSLAGPTRTTVAVRELPHPHILIEMNAIAWIGSASEPTKVTP